MRKKYTIDQPIGCTPLNHKFVQLLLPQAGLPVQHVGHKRMVYYKYSREFMLGLKVFIHQRLCDATDVRITESLRTCMNSQM